MHMSTLGRTLDVESIFHRLFFIDDLSGTFKNRNRGVKYQPYKEVCLNKWFKLYVWVICLMSEVPGLRLALVQMVDWACIPIAG